MQIHIWKCIRLNEYSPKNIKFNINTDTGNNRPWTLITECAKACPVESKVAQGSILGPSLFLHNINDIPISLSCIIIRLFADDTIAYMVVKSTIDAQLLQQDHDYLAKWEGKWKLAFHPDKRSVLYVTRNEQKPFKFYYIISYKIVSNHWIQYNLKYRNVMISICKYNVIWNIGLFPYHIVGVMSLETLVCFHII